MWQVLEKVLNKFETEQGVPYYRQGSLVEGEELPSSFLTFWNITTPEGAFYDNKPNEALWSWQIYIYTNDPSKLYSLADNLLEIAKAEGFVRQGRANDIASSIESYVGRTFSLKYIEKYNN